MTSPADLVTDAFAQAQTYATTNQAQLETFLTDLSSAVTLAPTVDVTFAPVTEPSSLVAPSRPGALDTIEAELTFDQSGSIAAAMPSDLAAVAPNIVIDDFSEADPTVDFGEAPTLDFGTAPTLTIGDAPTVPDVADVALPDTPSISLPSAPTYLALSTPTFAGVDLRTDFLTTLETTPTLDLVAPTPYTYSPGAQYTSDLLTALKAALAQRIAGGTGLDTTVETAIWDRARDREAATANAAIDQVTRDSEALGFALPAGVVNDGIRRAQSEYHDKVASLSRDIAIKQAELEQQNLRETITQAQQLEGQLIDYSYRLEALSFESAKYVAQNAIEVYNAQVDNFRALLQAFQTRAQVYDSIIKGQLAKVEVYRAEIAAEQAKADTNRTLVEQYKAGIQAQLALVEVYRGQLEGSKLLVEIEGAKVAAAGERVKAYVAGVNGQTARMEAYKVTVQAQGAKAEAYKAGVESKLATVKVFEAKAQAFSAKANAQGEKARAQIAYYEGLVKAYSAQWDGWKARVGAEAERVKAVGMKSQSALDGYRADIVRYEAEIRQDVEHWQAAIQQYKSQADYTLSAEKLNSDIVQSNNQAVLEAAKTGAQVYAQLTASSYSLIHASASVSAGSSNSVSYSYSNDTDSAATTITAV